MAPTGFSRGYQGWRSKAGIRQDGRIYGVCVLELVFLEGGEMILGSGRGGGVAGWWGRNGPVTLHCAARAETDREFCLCARH